MVFDVLIDPVMICQCPVPTVVIEVLFGTIAEHVLDVEIDMPRFVNAI